MEDEFEIKKIHLLSYEGCPGCAAAKEDLKEEMEKGEVVETKVDSEDGLKIVNAFGINSIPQLVLESTEGMYCLLDDNGEPGECITPDETVDTEEIEDIIKDYQDEPEKTEDILDDDGNVLVEGWKIDAIQNSNV